MSEANPCKPTSNHNPPAPVAPTNGQPADERLHDAPNAGPPAEQRLRAIAALLEQSLAQADPWQRNLGAAASDLAGIAFRLKSVIDSTLSETGPALARFEAVLPAIETYLKLTRQIDRLAQLQRLTSAT